MIPAPTLQVPGGEKAAETAIPYVSKVVSDTQNEGPRPSENIPIRPIMARLPISPAERMDEVSYDTPSTATGYLETGEGVDIPGTLAFDPINRGVTYTVSRLPVIDQVGLEMWKALHGLQVQAHELNLSRCALPDVQSFESEGNMRSDAEGGHLSIQRTGTNSARCPFASSARGRGGEGGGEGEDEAAGSAGTTPRTSAATLSLLRSILNWEDLCLPAHVSGTFYGVVFRSARLKQPPPCSPPAAETNAQLYAADRLAHEEAVAAGGLLSYIYGTPDPGTGTNLATCVWRSREDARRASALPLHRRAVRLAVDAYEWFVLDRYSVVKREGETGVRVMEWSGEAD